MAQTAVDILMFLANNPGYDTAKDICTMRHLETGDRFVPCGKFGSGRIPGAAECARGPEKVPVGLHGKRRRPLLKKGRALQAKFMRQMTKGLE